MHMERLDKFSELCVAERDCVQFEYPCQYFVEIAGYIKDKYYEIKIRPVRCIQILVKI